mgnify:CR=1 FL=1
MLEREIIRSTVVGVSPYPLLYAKVWGSHSHNTQLPESDVDYLGVYVAPTHEVLSIDKPAETVTHNKPDIEAHEVEKFCRLLLKGNPSMVEMLFTDKMHYMTEPWVELVMCRQTFLSQSVVKQYLGYANGQLMRLKKGTKLHTKGGEYNTKWAYHIIRVLGDAYEIAKGGAPVVWKEGPEHKLLMAIRHGEYEPERVVKMAGDMIGGIERVKPWALPVEGDRGRLNDWLLSIRMEESNA